MRNNEAPVISRIRNPMSFTSLNSGHNCIYIHILHARIDVRNFANELACENINDEFVLNLYSFRFALQILASEKYITRKNNKKKKEKRKKYDLGNKSEFRQVFETRLWP